MLRPRRKKRRTSKGAGALLLAQRIDKIAIQAQ
jgi:hypothetical protein